MMSKQVIVITQKFVYRFFAHEYKLRILKNELSVFSLIFVLVSIRG